jgi:hypothetical protein
VESIYFNCPERVETLPLLRFYQTGPAKIAQAGDMQIEILVAGIAHGVSPIEHWE